MMVQMFSLFDRAAKSFGGPVLASNVALMRRDLTAMLIEDQGRTNFGRYPDEFDCYLIGEFDTDVGTVSPCQPEMQFRLAELLPTNKG